MSDAGAKPSPSEAPRSGSARAGSVRLGSARPGAPRAASDAPSRVATRGHPGPGASPARGPALERVYVWDWVVRLTHWLIVAGILVLSVSGYFIGDPFSSTSGPATEHHLMAWLRITHFYASILFTLAVLARIAWMFLGPPLARWDQFLPASRARLGEMWQTFRFYVLLRRRPPPVCGHNALAGATYVLVFTLYLLGIASGAALVGVEADLDSPMRWFADLAVVCGGAQSVRWLHHVIMWLLLGFMVHHVYSALLMAMVEKNGVIDSIFSGHKFVSRGLRERGPSGEEAEDA